MDATQENSKRIAKNTAILYVRMVFVLLVALYTSRVLLNVLGVEDYGLYNVVGGVVTMLGFFNGAMISSAQRFFAFAIGRNDIEELNKNYSAILTIQVGLAILILIIAESIGLWFVKNYLVIPEGRLTAVLWVYQSAVIAFIASMLQVPFASLVITYERMNVYAIISIVDVLLRLAIVLILPYATGYDQLIVYALLLSIVSLSTLTAYVAYRQLKFRHIKFKKIKESALYKRLLSYMGWNLWGNSAVVVMNQGVNILLNIFFGPVVNAARAIAYQVSAAIHQLVTNFQLAMNPQIVKSYAAGNLTYMHQLVLRGSKFSFFLIFAIALPVAIEADFFLKLWLKNVPYYTVLFTRLVLILVCIDSLSGTLITAAQASGKIKVYQSVVGGLLILNLPISYVALKLGAPPEATMIVAIGMSIVCLLARLVILKPLVSLDIKEFMIGVIIPTMAVAISAISVALLLKKSICLSSTILNSLLLATLSFLLSLFLIFFIGLDKEERHFITSKTSAILHKK